MDRTGSRQIRYGRVKYGMLLAFALVVPLLGTGCVEVQERPVLLGEARAPRERLVWPQPPAEPRIEFLDVIAHPGDIGAHKSFLRRLGETIFGRSEERGRMGRPVGVAANRGKLYVADPGSQALHVYNLEKSLYRKVTQAGSQQLISPVGITLGRQGSIFVSDSYLGKIVLFDAAGRFLKSFGGEELKRPVGVTFDEKAGLLYVADTLGHRILAYTEQGEVVRSLGKRGRADGEFNYPTWLWLDRRSVLYVVDSLNYRIQVFDRDGRFLAKFGQHGDGSGDFAMPKGIATDSQGHIYVVDALFDTVQAFDQRGRLLMAFGGRGLGPGRFWLPAGLYIDQDDKIYVADSSNQRIQVFSLLREGK